MLQPWTKWPLVLFLAAFGLAGFYFLKAAPWPARAASGRSTTAALPPVTITINEVFASGFSLPIQATHAGDGSLRLFVVEQGGAIRIVKNGAVLPTPFINLSNLVVAGGERGLLGLAFHPNYKTNGYFYVNYTRAGDGATVIARYSVSGANPDVADPASAVILLTIDQPFPNHNGGQLLFGPDGYLYISTGDGGSGGDPGNRAQDINSLLGKMLRINVNGGSPYAVPDDNPYVGKAGQDEIWALGLRNPWRFSFDRVTGDMYIGDVGQNVWEEVDYQAAGTSGGVNFGWRCKEGTHPFNFSDPCSSLALTDPIAEYSHSEGNAVTGGFVYRGNQYPALTGRYFYADFGTGKIWSMYKTGANSWSAPELEWGGGINISAFGEDETGELYVVDYSGKIRRLADINGPQPITLSAVKSSSRPDADPGEVITYTVRLSNTGGLIAQSFLLEDTLPAGLEYVPGSLSATSGSVDPNSAPLLRWQGPLWPSPVVTVTYQVTVTGQVSGSLVNQVQVSGDGLQPLSLAHALFVPRSVLATTHQDFFLPGTQPGSLTDAIPDPAGCDFCHTAPIYDRWRGSMMSQAGRDPLLWAALAVANHDASGAGEYCLRCHAPKGWLEGRSQPADGSALQAGDLAAGVACEICHRMVDPVPSPADEAKHIDADIRAALSPPVPTTHPGSAMMIVDPEDRRRGPFAFDPDPPHPKETLQTDFLGQSANAMAESRLCGSCHNVDNPTLSWDETRQQFWPNGTDLAAPAFDEGDLFPIETTFDEWANSEYAQAGVYAPQFAGAKPDGLVRSCQDCHMTRTTGRAAEDIYNPVYRDCSTTGCLPTHDLVGGNTWVPQLLQDSRWRLHSSGDAANLNQTILSARQMLRQAATVTLTVTTSDTDKLAIIRVTNETGHKLPTGYPEGRRIWLNVRAYAANGQLLQEWGAYDPATGQLSDTAKVYEARQGITPELASILKQNPGESFHFVLNNTVLKDNRIPPRGYKVPAFARPGLEPVGASYADDQYWDETIYVLPAETERVTAILYYQTASKEYVDFLRTNGGVDGFTLGQLWDSSKSPPEVMATAVDNPFTLILPIIYK